MPTLTIGTQRLEVPTGANLLDTLLAAGCSIPHSCRAGSCQACRVRCVRGEPGDAKPDALPPAQRAKGWRLACQCSVQEDLGVAPFDPQRDGLPAVVTSIAWTADVLRLRVRPDSALRYRPGQHVLLWQGQVARPYSLASLPGEDQDLEFHLDCRHPGQFCDRARLLEPGAPLHLSGLHGGALHYDPDWHARPLLLLAAGTGLAPLWGILREAQREGHAGGIQVLHVARSPEAHYLAAELGALQGVKVRLVLAEALDEALAALRLDSRHTVALACGSPSSVERFARRLFMLGLPRNQVFTDVFTERD